MRKTSRPDIVYPVRKGDYNEELRYSLRSLSHIPHGRVFIVGHKPPWVTNVAHWPRPQEKSKYRNANESLVEITREAGASLTEPFLLFNDDFYVMEPMDEIPVFHMGPVQEVVDRYRKLHHMGAYWRGMVQTMRLMQDARLKGPLLSYELHIPFPIYREPLLRAWEMGKELDVLHIRTLMGNLARLGGTEREDVKVYRGRTKDYESWPFLSSNDDVTFPPLRSLMRERFPTPSPYELQ